MLNYPTDIPEDPTDVYVAPVFKEARVIVHQYIQNMDDAEIIDDTEFMMFQETDPHHIFPELGENTSEEKTGLIDIHIRAPYCEKTHTILPSRECEDVTVLDMNLGVQRSASILVALSPEQQIALTQFAFATRHTELQALLTERIATRKSHPILSERIELLHLNFDLQVKRILNLA